MIDRSKDRAVIEAACDQFEASLRSGASPSVLEALQACDERLWSRLAPELLFLDVEHARQAGLPADLPAYQRRYPRLLKYLETAFAVLESGKDPAGGGAAAAEGLRPGALVGHYELEARIGRGAKSSVWRATDTITDRTVALKLPHWEGCSIDERLRFLREGRTLARLDHDGIVRLFEQDRDSLQPYLAIEYFEGGTLANCLADGPMPAEAASRLCARLAEAAAHAHGRGVIHRDIKPANILLTAEGMPVLCDFGLAREVDEATLLTECGDIVGTVAYMSPEQASGRGSEADERSDVYSIGAILYECLTGARLNQGGAATILRGLSDPPKRASASRNPFKVLERGIARICEKATESRPGDRYPGPAELADDLDRWRRGDPISVGGVKPLGYQLRRIWRRTPRAIALAIMSAATVFAVMAAGKPNEWRDVEISTVPIGGRVAFVPLGERGDRPQVEKAVFGAGSASVRLRLLPDRYLVIGALPDGRFHEVFRVVPSEGSDATRFGWFDDFQLIEGGVVRLPPIRIPRSDLEEQMVLIEGCDDYRPGSDGDAGLPATGCSIRSFYIDKREFDPADLPNGFGGGAAKPGSWTGTYYAAVDAAESAGKRLPTELEFEFAARGRGSSRFPWGNEFPTALPASALQDSGLASFDRLATNPSVTGLASGLAEWTSPSAAFDPARPRGYQVVRGGGRVTIEGDLLVSAETRDPSNREYAISAATHPGVGFRGVRSAAPLIAYEEMR